jgi:hypothetical protein
MSPNLIRLSLEQIHTEAEKDLALDKDELTLESVRTPGIFSKYNKMLSVEKVALKHLYFQLKKVEKEQWEYYSGKADPEIYQEHPFGHKIRPGNIDKYLNSDDKLDQMRAKVFLQEEKVAAIERIMKAINDRQWIIRNAIENQKFLAGL